MRNAFDYLQLPNPAAVGTAFEDGLKRGRVQSALSAFAADPTSSAPIGALMAVDPATALKLREYQRDEAKAQRDDEYRSALSGYIRSQQRPTTAALASAGALGGSASRSLQAPAAPGAPGEGAITSGLPASDGPVTAPDFSSLGQPQSDADHHFLQMLERDPARALEVQSKLRDNFVDQLKATREGYSIGLAMLGGVRDEATYQQRRVQIIQRLAPLGMDASTVLPERFPGEDGLREIQLQALGVKDQLSLFMQQANIEADNERADRNTDSLIEDREERRGETRRYHDVQAGVSRRGQDVRDRTQRRGQDLRGSGGGRGARSGGSAPSGPVRVKTPEEARALPPGTKFRDPNGVVRVR